LIGAVAIVVILVVFVPMVLDSEPRPARTPALPIPSKDNAPPLPAPTPKVETATPKVDVPVKMDPMPPGQIPAQQPVGAPSRQMAQPKFEAPKVAAAPQPKAEAPRLEGFAVQVGAFRDEAKLKQAREKLVAAGVPHYTERLDSQGGALTRLRAGPFPTREAAEAAQAVLKRSALDGKVVPLP
jgi:DedD protein